MISPVSEERKQWIRQEFSQGFVACLGIEPVEIDAGIMQSRLQIRDDHRQQDGFVHAGVMSTMADHTMGYAAWTQVPDGHRILTIEFKMNFLRPASGEYLDCRARVVKPGRRILVCEAEVYDLRAREEWMVVKALASMASVRPD